MAPSESEVKRALEVVDQYRQDGIAAWDDPNSLEMPVKYAGVLADAYRALESKTIQAPRQFVEVGHE